MSKNMSDEALRKAAAKLAEARIAAQPSLDELDHEFSPEFESAMDKLMQKSQRKAIWRRVASIAASLLFVLLIGAGAVLTFSQEARASFVTWLREQYENSIIYRFWGGGDTSEFPTYQIGWLPDGYELLQEIEDEKDYTAVYYSNDKGMIVFSYAFFEQWNEIFTFNDNVDNHEQLSIRGMYGEYVPFENRAGGDLIWIDESRQIALVLSTELEKDTIIKIAESVLLVK